MIKIPNLIEDKVFANKTPSYNSRPLNIKTFKPDKIQPPGEESNAYYKTLAKGNNKSINKKEEGWKWKNMTQQHIFDNSKYAIENSLKQNDLLFTGANKITDPKFLELPSTLKNIGDSDIDIDDKISNEEFSNDEEFKTAMNKSNNQCFQNNTSKVCLTKKIALLDENLFGESGSKYDKSENSESMYAENMDTVNNINWAVDENKEMSKPKWDTLNYKSIKDKMGDLIDSSGGTIDAVDVLQSCNLSSKQNDEIIQQDYNHKSDLNISKSGNKGNLKQIQSSESTQKIKERLKELTKLDGKNLIKDEEILYPLKPGQALRNFMNKLSDYEKGEILDYK